MSENDHYKWLELRTRLYLHAAASHRTNDPPDDDDSGCSPRLRGIYAQAGTFDGALEEAANDFAALLFTLLLILWWSYVKTGANLIIAILFLRKLTPGQFFQATAAESAQNQAFPVFIVSLLLCHFDHLPTRPRSCCLYGAAL